MSDGNGNGNGGNGGATDDILVAERVSKIFGGLVAVNDVSFSIPRRSIVSIIGPNGAGKTTFFNMLTGLYKPSAGRITFESKNVTSARPDLITKAGVARTFQNIRLFATMTALENVMVGQHARMRAGIFGFLLVIVMVLMPEGLLPERRHRLERVEHAGTDESVFEVDA